MLEGGWRHLCSVPHSLSIPLLRESWNSLIQWPINLAWYSFLRNVMWGKVKTVVISLCLPFSLSSYVWFLKSQSYLFTHFYLNRHNVYMLLSEICMELPENRTKIEYKLHVFPLLRFFFILSKIIPSDLTWLETRT